MSKSYVELDVSDFGSRELAEVASLIDSWIYRDKTNRFGDLEKIGFNLNSGNVFLVDQDHNVAMTGENEGRSVLLDFFSCPDCGHEWLDGDEDVGDLEACCKRYADYDEEESGDE